MIPRITRLLAICTASILFTAVGCDKGTNSSTSTDGKTAGGSATTEPSVGRAGHGTTQPAAMTQAMGGKTAMATITPAKAAATQPANQAVSGMVMFTQTGDGVKVTGDLMGLAPGKHGIHIHEKADMSDASLASLGGHWDPDMHKHHGGPTGDMRHGGDLGNIEADDTGKAHVDVTVAGLTVGDGSAHDVVGHSIVVHAKEDDMKTDPSGNSGGRVAAGVIQGK